MKRHIVIIALVLIAVRAEARTINRFTVEEGGSGPYKAEIVEDEELPGYSIARPADMQAAVSVEGTLPVILFGNGGCMRDSWPFHKFITELASYGYVIITNGRWSPEPGFKQTQQAGPRQEMTREQMLENFKKVEEGNKSDAKDYLRALDWLEREAEDSKSEYYGMVDVSRTAAAGQSCGGLQALILGTSGDPRIKTTMPLNSGVTSSGDGLSGMIGKEDLAKLEKPVCYLIGGKGDIAYPNAADDFKRIANVPVVIANLEVGHGGTYSESNGGSFADMALLWLDWQLKGREENELLFRYSQVPPYLEGWTMTSRNFDSHKIVPLLEDRPEENTEEVMYNDFGEVTGYRKVNDPCITVRLPQDDKADGSAVIVFPGGALVSLTWDAEFKKIADWLNAKGVAAIGVKYRLKSDFGQMPRPAEGTADKFRSMRAEIFDFPELRNANTNPSGPDTDDPGIDYAAEDALRAMDIVLRNADNWNINPDKVGWMGFSAGGGVALAAMMKASDELMPSFLCSVYGPSLVDIIVPENAPKLYVAVHADHPNVAAGCMALFMEWKKAGIDSEIHVYGKNTGGLFTGKPDDTQKHTHEGFWMESFYSWMTANGFAH